MSTLVGTGMVMVREDIIGLILLGILDLFLLCFGYSITSLLCVSPLFMDS